MFTLQLFMGVIAVTLVGLLIHHFRRYRQLTAVDYVPAAAWTRAFIYFCACYLVSYATGAMELLLTSPLVTEAQWHDPVWWASTLGCLGLILGCYFGIWARWTLYFDRKVYFWPQLLFGAVWGSALGQLLITFFHLFKLTGWPLWGVWLGTFTVVGMWQGLWQDLYWDVYVSPEHDTPKSIMLKTFLTHIPNVTFCLTYLAVYENYAIFVGLQSLALVAASLYQRLPPPWETRAVLAPRTAPGLFGLPHATGYISDDPDPYATQRRQGA